MHIYIHTHVYVYIYIYTHIVVGNGRSAWSAGRRVKVTTTASRSKL